MAVSEDMIIAVGSSSKIKKYANENTKVIDLEGNNRIISKVDFWYDTKGGLLNDKAVIELWGRK